MKLKFSSKWTKPAKQPWWIWINTSCEFIINDYITTTKQSTTKPCAYFLGYTVNPLHAEWLKGNIEVYLQHLLDTWPHWDGTVYPKKYAHGFVVLCFVVVMQSFILNSYEVFIHIHQGCFAGTGAIVRLPQCQWSKPDGYGKISQCITTTKHNKAKTVCIFLGIYCSSWKFSWKEGSVFSTLPILLLCVCLRYEGLKTSPRLSFTVLHYRWTKLQTTS